MTKTIKRIKCIKPDGICDSFFGREAQEFKKYNVIFGRNGAGKTSIARMLYNLDDSKDNRGGFIFGGEEKKSNQYIKVFTGQYTKENLYYDALDSEEEVEIQKILYLGEQSKIAQKIEKENRRKERVERRKSALEEKNKITIRERAALIKDSVGGATLGSNDYSYYNRAGLERDLNTIMNQSETNKWSCQNDDLDKYIEEQTLIAKEEEVTLNNITQIKQEVGNLNKILMQRQLKKIKDLCNQKVEQGVIKKLKDNADFNFWVRQGYELHRQHGSQEKCWFCENDIKPTRWANLAQHFSQAYDTLERNIKEAIDSCKEIEQFSELSEEGKCYEELKKEYSDNFSAIEKDIESYNTFVSQLKKLLEEKQRKMLEVVTVKIKVPSINTSNKVSKLEDTYKKHAAYTKEIGGKKKEALKELFQAYIEKNKNWVEEYRAFRERIDKWNALWHKADERIVAQRGKLDESDEDMDELNSRLNEVFKHQNIKFKSNNKGYTLERSKKVAVGLSEGEKNIIALAYFVYSLNDTSNKGKEATNNDVGKKDLCVVLDDPITSFDNEMFYTALAMITNELLPTEKDKEGNPKDIISQFFLFTHNFLLINHITDILKIDSRTRNGYYELNNDFADNPQNLDGNGNIIKLSDVDQNTIKYIAEYHFIFKQVYIFSQEEKPSRYAQQRNANAIRRLIESFSAFYFPGVDDLYIQIEKLLEFSNQEKNKTKKDRQKFANKRDACKMGKVINYYSHATSPNAVSAFSPKDLDIVYIARKILNAIEKCCKSHYDGMEEWCKKQKQGKK